MNAKKQNAKRPVAFWRVRALGVVRVILIFRILRVFLHNANFFSHTITLGNYILDFLI